MPLQLEIALVSLWCSVAVALIGSAFLWLLRRSSLVVMMVVLIVIPVAGIAASVVALALMDRLAYPDLKEILLVCIPCTAVSLVVCLLLGRRFLHGSRDLARATRSMGAGGRFAAPAGDSAAEWEVLSQELAAMSAALAASRAHEQLLETSRRQLIAWVSHDLRTPLGSLRAMAEALQDGVAPDQDRYHRQILLETQRLDQLVTDLFDLSRIQSRSLTLSLRTVPLFDLISDTVSACEPQARGRGVRLAHGGIAAVEVRVDVRQLSRLLGNLLGNAIRHTRPGGTVTVAAAADGDKAVVTVSDACGGIAATDLDKVFEPGWRGSAARTGTDTGGGLGLAIVRGIAEAHHGTVAVRNIPGGCEFGVTLPAAR
ncbi:sensor histidine kinase [Amycolatopsis samaneae]|uniref:Sensor-like histidine kinase SenX3 n=1 Tax=Amycolatopsis samaneae TaxID=664691 RepID=A0ABW5GLW0_9PSEU